MALERLQQRLQLLRRQVGPRRMAGTAILSRCESMLRARVTAHRVSAAELRVRTQVGQPQRRWRVPEAMLGWWRSERRGGAWSQARVGQPKPFSENLRNATWRWLHRLGTQTRFGALAAAEAAMPAARRRLRRKQCTTTRCIRLTHKTGSATSGTE